MTSIQTVVNTVRVVPFNGVGWTEPGVTLEADNTAPDPTGPRHLLSPLVASWQTPTIPPTAQPSTVTVQVVDDGTGPDGFLPVNQGDPVTVFVTVDGVLLLPFKGRVTDVSAVNLRDGGVVFTLVCSDWLSDAAGTGSPITIAGFPSDFTLAGAYSTILDDLADDTPFQTAHVIGPAPVNGGWLPGLGSTNLLGMDIRLDIDLTNVSSLDALNRFIAVWWTRLTGLGQVLTPFVDVSSLHPFYEHPSSGDQITYGFDLFDPAGGSGFAGAFHLVYDGAMWRLEATAGDYYADGGTGIVLDASQLALDVGEWRKTRAGAINTVEQTGKFETAVASGNFIELVRRQIAGDGRNTYGIESPLRYRDDAREVGDLILGPAGNLPDDYGASSLTVAWELLDADAKAAWGGKLWPAHVTPLDQGGPPAVTGYSEIDVRGRPLAVVGIPDRWRVVDQPAMFARATAMQATVTADDVRLAFTVQPLPFAAGGDTATGGITSTELATLAPSVTSNNLDPAISYDQMALVSL